MNDMNDIAVNASDRNAVKITEIECIPLNRARSWRRSS